ncbi:hypothetical protein [Arthrobacter sp. M4]|uniref:hypothetical protein n=1 Tax=Arthrobacter sp. M4 TaxID=218160 RepID=UPI001CDD5A5A|nr:hypothetical protein [Arthrobacter sp. M4]MCA4135530.1 hypothetical protein [Arthrobacter sp. M4]
MDDPTTIALNLTFLGTLGLAFVMFVGLAVVVMITLVLAGIGRLISVILLALVGIFPRRESTLDIVQLPEQPHHRPRITEGIAATSGTGVDAAERQPISARVNGAMVLVSAWFESTWSSLREFQWNSVFVRRKAPQGPASPAGVRAAAEAGSAQHLPLAVTTKHHTQAMSPKWAAAVAEADARAEERAKAAAPPEIVVTVRDLPPSEAPAEAVEKVAPLVESVVDPHGPRKKRPASSTPSNAMAGSAERKGA